MMSEVEIVDYCLSMPGACIRYPYGTSPMVISTADVHEFCEVYEGTTPLHIVLKCDPQEAIRLRNAYPAIKPGYRCNKKHWNSVFVDETIPDALLKQMIENSYKLMSKYKRRKA